MSTTVATTTVATTTPGRGTVLGVGIAVVLAFILSSAWYAVLSGAAAYSTATPAWMVPVELLRSTVVASGLAVALTRFRAVTAGQAALLGLGVFVAIPVVLLTGSVLYDGTPVAHALLHGGDWLIKLVMVAVVIVAVRRRAERLLPSVR